MAAAVKTSPSIQAARAKLMDLNHELVADLTIIVADEHIPEVVMFNGDPFLFQRAASDYGRFAGVLCYRQVRPFRADIGA